MFKEELVHNRKVTMVQWVGMQEGGWIRTGGDE